MRVMEELLGGRMCDGRFLDGVKRAVSFEVNEGGVVSEGESFTTKDWLVKFVSENEEERRGNRPVFERILRRDIVSGGFFS
jgi:hypothetical protein